MENGKNMKNYAHIQISKDVNSTIYVVEFSQVNNFLNELSQSGIDISKSFLLKTTTGF
jgi:hypothetical protein